MSIRAESYADEVAALEGNLAAYAKKSFEPFSQAFVDGGDIHKTYADQWRNPETSARLTKRTPLQIERDRILYSFGIRKQTEKYHVLYNGQRRIVRNYTTHTMRMAQVTRAMSRALDLNADFAEAIALGSKVGALPFVYASKDAVSSWVRAKLLELDHEFAKNDPCARPPKQQLAMDFGADALPSWIEQLRSSYVLDRVRKYVPWAAGQSIEQAYSSGQQAYWQLSTNPYVVESKSRTHYPETMYGIWRHSRGIPHGKGAFHHRCSMTGASSGHHEISWENLTYEAIVVQYADDITWIIENLNDANSAALLNNRRSVYDSLIDVLERDDRDTPESLFRALQRHDAGRLYTYFIDDFIRTSHARLLALRDGAVGRMALREGLDQAAFIGLSAEAESELNRMAEFLHTRVFTEPRLQNRFAMLKTISVACVDLLYNGTDGVLPRVIRERGILERWGDDKTKRAEELISDSVHRVQLAVNIFADMGDQEIYDFVGIQSL